MPISRKSPTECPIERCLSALSGRWKAQVIWLLRNEPRRYSELFHQLEDVQERVLSQVLLELSGDGVIEKQPNNLWALTPKGVSLEPVLREMFEWGSRG